MSKKVAPIPQIELDDSVKLKPIAGIRPGVYLTVLYSIILLVILYFIFIHHGVKNYGAVLDITTNPSGAAVRINDVYMGISGTKIPMPNSIKPLESVKIDIVLPGFEMESETHEIPGRVFGTRFFPLCYKLNFTLKTNDPAGVLAQSAAEYAMWTFGGEPTEAWQIPLVLSEGAYRVGSGSREQGAMNSEILKAASRFTVTRAALRDLIRAKALIDNSGNAPSPAAITDSISDILVFLSENPGSAEWLASLLPPESSAIVRESAWYKNSQTPEQSMFMTAYTGQVQMEIEGLRFINITNFSISENPVPKTLFETFLAENSVLNDQNHYIDYFVDELTRHPAQIYDANIVTGASWYTAEAFCQWLTGRLPSSISNMEVRLPTWSEMDLAFRSGIRVGNPGWEWCADFYAPLDFAVSSEAVQAIGSPERTLYKPDENKASLPPDFCSPFVTFRVTLIQTENNE